MCRIKLRLFLLLFLLFSFPIWSMTVSDVKSNLEISQSLLKALNEQFNVLEKDLDDKNNSLIKLQNVNLELNQQLTELENQLTLQTSNLKSLQTENQQLTETSAQLSIQLTSLNEQLTAQYKELMKKALNSKIVWGCIGLLVGFAGGTVLMLTLN